MQLSDLGRLIGLEPALYVVLGWLFGLLSPKIVDVISRPTRRREIRDGIFHELRDLRMRLAQTVFLVARRTGRLNRELLEWIRPIQVEYQGFYSNRFPVAVEHLDHLLTLSDDELADASHDSNLSTQMPKYELPYLEAHLTSLHLFSPEFHRQALEAHSKLRMIQTAIDDSHFFFERTFDANLAADNRARLVQNTETTYKVMRVNTVTSPT